MTVRDTLELFKVVNQLKFQTLYKPQAKFRKRAGATSDQIKTLNDRVKNPPAELIDLLTYSNGVTVGDTYLERFLSTAEISSTEIERRFRKTESGLTDRQVLIAYVPNTRSAVWLVEKRQGASGWGVDHWLSGPENSERYRTLKAFFVAYHSELSDEASQLRRQVNADDKEAQDTEEWLASDNPADRNADGLPPPNVALEALSECQDRGTKISLQAVESIIFDRLHGRGSRKKWSAALRDVEELEHEWFHDGIEEALRRTQRSRLRRVSEMLSAYGKKRPATAFNRYCDKYPRRDDVNLAARAYAKACHPIDTWLRQAPLWPLVCRTISPDAVVPAIEEKGR